MFKKISKITIYNFLIFFFIVFLFELIFHNLGFEVKKKYLKPYYGNYDFGINTYPKNYFEFNSELGFDIKPDANQKELFFYSPNGVLKIFSNDFGCFDKNKNYKNYIYLGGDSFIWGYDDYNKTIGVILEKKLNQTVAKCGVTNTGQKHQFIKFQNFLKKNLEYPKKIIIGHYSNDLSNDFLFPESTVINGWMVKNPKDHNQFRKIKKTIIKLEENHNHRMSTELYYNLKNKHWLIYIINNSFFISSVREIREYFKNKKKEKIVKIPEKDAKISKNKKCSYETYNSINCVNKNKEAILDFMKFSDTNNIKLLIILFPDLKDLKNNEDTYTELRNFLDNKNIDYINLYSQIKSSKIDLDKFFNRDGHFSEHGNKFLIRNNIDKFK